MPITSFLIVCIPHNLTEVPISPQYTSHFSYWRSWDLGVQRQCKFTGLLTALGLEYKGSILCIGLRGLWCVVSFASRFVIVCIIHPLRQTMCTWIIQRTENVKGNPLDYSYYQTRGTHYRVVCCIYTFPSMQNEVDGRKFQSGQLTQKRLIICDYSSYQRIHLQGM